MSPVAKLWMKLICTRVSLAPKIYAGELGVVIDLTELHHLPTMYIIGNLML
ncbi:hypothetical protein V6Z11_D11G244600 [Gossypium hirsutum]